MGYSVEKNKGWTMSTSVELESDDLAESFHTSSLGEYLGFFIFFCLAIYLFLSDSHHQVGPFSLLLKKIEEE